MLGYEFSFVGEITYVNVLGLILGSEDGIKDGFLLGLLHVYSVGIEEGIKDDLLPGIFLGLKCGIEYEPVL